MQPLKLVVQLLEQVIKWTAGFFGMKKLNHIESREGIRLHHNLQVLVKQIIMIHMITMLGGF